MGRIMLCLPHNYPTYNRTFVENLLQIIQAFNDWNFETGRRYELQIAVNHYGWIDHMRDELAQYAIEKKADYILWLDTDETFPPDLIKRLIEDFEDNPGVDAVTGFYVWKTPPFTPHIYHKYEDDKFTIALGFPTDELFPVEGAGFGCLMMKRSLIENLERPRFEYKYGVYGEDLWFFRNLKKKGIPYTMLCDPTIHCGHLTEICVGFPEYLKYNNIGIEDGFVKVDEATIERVNKQQSNMVKKAGIKIPEEK